MIKKIFNDRTAGRIGKSLLIVITSLWCYWSIGEMYHEGWWGPFYIRLIYLIPGTAFLALTLVAIKWPQIGGWLIVIFGGLFTVMFMDIHIVEGKLSVDRDITGSLVIAPLVFLGILLLIEGRNLKRRLARGWTPHARWWRRNLWILLALIPPLAILIGLSAYSLPFVLTRMDDGERGIRLIDGNGSALLWAPEGPGWNWKQDYGGYPSWNMVALYGVLPVGFQDKPGYDAKNGEFATEEEMLKYNLCLFLSEDGTTLETEAQNIWRMPTIRDYAGAFARHGKNAGCIWQGEGYDQMTCDIKPDKETPLWAPDLEPIYYWAAEEADERNAYFVSFNGWVNETYKAGGNPRHSYRCVREP
ncbi:MAG: hypothetical protein CVU43_07880 [Chloroflexi bacterium HGW-Chloroflexi-5]|jgi:hypothetical protein|nr:MAG: hypothetical protein CVU43_07880 [Chloroflexi bacterium HGW-Chloroflexi-5]